MADFSRHIPGPSGQSPAQIEAREAAAAANLGSFQHVHLPIASPNDKAYDALSELGVVFGERIDRVLIKAELPAGWRIVCNSSDPRHRELHDGSGQLVAYIFMKNSGYDYYGSVSMV